MSLSGAVFGRWTSVAVCSRCVVPEGPPGKKKAAEEEEKEDETESLPAPTGEPRATVVVIGHELSPRQLRNIQRATSAAEVWIGAQPTKRPVTSG